MAYNFTEEQLRAITLRDRTLLVSAAAGSGKTATLTGRIIASLSDEEHPTSLSRLVVATFTTAAAADMRKKIAKALSAAIAANPQNRRLVNEELLLPSARISTIDSYFAGLLRANADAAGIPQSFRFADATENDLLSAEVMEELLDDLFSVRIPEVGEEEFLTLADTLSDVKNEGNVASHLLSLYEKVLHEPRGVAALRDAAERYRAESGKPFLKTSFGGEIADRYAGIFRDLATALRDTMAQLVGVEERSLEKRIPYCRAEAELLDELATMLQAREDAVRERLTPNEGAIRRIDAGDCRENRDLGAIHSEVMARRRELKNNYFCYTDAEFLALTERLASLCDLLFRILSLFDARLTAEKRRRNIMSFLDVSRAVYHLLVAAEETGEGGLPIVHPTPLAREIGRGIDCVYIDEFQDVNPLQYNIFRAIAREDNLFMVGDVKQCIYAFRHSDPSIFGALRALFPPPREPRRAATLYFTKNFRSNSPILRYVNRVVGPLLRVAGGAPYTAEDDLALGKLPPRGEEPVRTHIFTAPPRTQSEEDEGGEPSVHAAREAAWVAGEIARLLREGRRDDGSPIKPSDIALLFETNHQMAPFVAAISAVTEVAVCQEQDFFLNPEVRLALSLLYTVDNPRRDIYLAAVLRSPIFGVTMGELVTIRTEQREADTLYDALCAYLAAHPEFEKGKRFLKTLEEWRRSAEGETVDALMLRIFRDAGLMTLTGTGTTPYHDNLYRLYQYARSFEASSYRGLYSFISYVNTAIENKAKILKPVTAGQEEAVHFMTIHSSKGLEYPVVFLCGIDHLFNHRDTTPTLLYDRRFGAAVKLMTERGDIAENPIRSLFAERMKTEGVRERIRLLYVALTRAQERLYVTGTTSKPEERCEAASLFSTLFFEWQILSGSCFLSWILPTLAYANDPYLVIHPAEEVKAPEGEVTGAAQDKGRDAPRTEDAKALSEALAARIAFRYPDEAMTTLPEKLSVSRLSPIVLDGTDGETAPPTLPTHHRPSIPTFLSGKAQDEAALAGTATHLFMQFCRFDRLSPEGLDGELARLVREQFITAEDAARVRRDEVAAFCHSALFARLGRACRLRRELRFHALLSAAAFTKEEERRTALADRRLLVQGVIDCVMEEEDGYVVIDYKTDRLTAAELADRALAEKKLLTRHSEQLAYYAAACTEMYGKPPKEILLYSLPLADTVAYTPQ